MDDLDDFIAGELCCSQRERCATITAASIAMPFVAADAICFFVDALPFIERTVHSVDNRPRYGCATFAPSQV
ncbi:hypothetical protein BCCGELA001_29160 [Bradyrhizobium sp. CCGE-LA001]|nr:hypothetical protein BCCGELA001_29160 [Bradyrhizobium sp. CCGE-LA001]